jgi:histidinol dehydrogenase
VTTSKKFAKTMKNEDIKGYIVLAKNIDQAVEVINRIAPEHLEILIKSPNRILKKIQNAGAIFIGPYSPVCIGDYVAGPSHVMPTGGTARFASPLNVMDFVKITSIIDLDETTGRELSRVASAIARVEGLTAHAAAADFRAKLDADGRG